MPIQRSDDPNAFMAFEHEGWSAVIGDYERLLGPLTLQTVDAIIEAAKVGAGDRILDICTGHGILAAAAAQRGAIVRGLDFSEQVLAVARRNVPQIDFDLGDAHALPYAAGSFDKVVCSFGIVHLSAPDLALAEMSRVLKSHGRIAVSVWQRSSQNTGFGRLFGAVKSHGRLDVPLPHGPDFFQFGDEGSMRAALAEVGFTDVSASIVEQAWMLEHASDFVEAITQGSVRARALLRGQDERALLAIKAAMESSMAAFATRGGGYRVPMPAVVGSGVKV